MLEQGEVAFGLWITIDSTDLVEVASIIGFDWLLFDMEHAPLTIRDVQDLIQVVDAEKSTPIIRVAWNDPVLIKLALDVGAHGILVPWVNSKEEAELAVKSVKYPPEGIRGYGPRRASMYGLKLKEYLEFVRQGEISLIIQIETKKALENLDEILEVKGIDAAFIGPWDLSTSLGHIGEPSHPEVQEAIKLILDKCTDKGVPVGIYASPDLKTALNYIKMGFKFIALGSDLDILIKFGREVLSELRKRA